MMSWSILKSEKEYKKALKRLDEIFHPRNTKEQDEFDLLVLLINKYEDENYSLTEVDPISVIKAKMAYFNLKQKDLIEYFGSKSTTSKILSYKSPLTLKHVWLLSMKLNIPIELLAKPYKIDEWNFLDKYDKEKIKKLKMTSA